MKEAMAVCPICGRGGRFTFEDRTWKIDGDGREFRYGECSDCRLLFCVPTPTDPEIEAVYGNYYKDYYKWFVQHRFLKKLQGWHRYRRLVSIFQRQGFAWTKRKILDIGCGHGWFLDEAMRGGWQAYGVEYLEDELLLEMRRRGLNIAKGTLESIKLPGNSFDLITMWHVLEHMRDPRKALSIVEDLLCEQGYCVVAVPNREAKSFEKVGVEWEWLQEPFIHVSSFSRTALERILPSRLHVVQATSRDTWDQQYARYTIFFIAYRTLLRYLVSGPRVVFETLGLKTIAKLIQQLDFFLYECGLLVSYGCYVALRWLLKNFERDLRGSELMVIIQKNSERFVGN